jgi:phage terminase small subunit
MPSAAVRIVQETASTIAKFATHFGLSPAARTAIKVGAAMGEGDRDGAEKYLTG